MSPVLPAAADGPLALAASKASVGHAEAGAGLVGFAAVVLSVEERALPRMLHLRWGLGTATACPACQFAFLGGCPLCTATCSLPPALCVCLGVSRAAAA